MLPPRPCEQPVARPKSSANNCRGDTPFAERVPVPAVSTEDDVVAPQVRTDSGGDRLLADVGVAGPMNQATLIGARQLLFAAPDQDHRAIKGQELLFAQIGRSVGRTDCCDHGLAGGAVMGQHVTVPARTHAPGV